MTERKVLFITTGLDAGGAEQTLLRLLDRLREGPVRPALVSLRSGGSLAPAAVGLDLPFLELAMERGSLGATGDMLRLVRFARKIRPEIVQGWMYHGNAAASLASLTLPGSRTFWSVRQSLADPATEKAATSRLVRKASWLHRRPERIVYNSRLAASHHEALGFPDHCRTIIHNGFDTDRFRPDPDARERIRRELGLNPDSPLIGMVARHHPVKDHAGFLQAAAGLANVTDRVRFVLVGAGVTPDNPELADAVQSLGLADRCRLLGERDDIPAITAALDVAALTSRSEGFPNVVGEAMACGIPVAATDAGETAEMLNGVGTVVPCADPDAMAAAWKRLLDLPEAERRVLGEAGRARVLDRYGIARMVAAFEKLYLEAGG